MKPRAPSRRRPVDPVDDDDANSPVAVERRLALAVKMLDAAVTELRELMSQLQTASGGETTTTTDTTTTVTGPSGETTTTDTTSSATTTVGDTEGTQQ